MSKLIVYMQNIDGFNRLVTMGIGNCYKIVTKNNKNYKIKMTDVEIGEKDVPNGLPFLIIDKSELPDDKNFKSAWYIDEKFLPSGIGKNKIGN